jgi:hypothetical protein
MVEVLGAVGIVGIPAAHDKSPKSELPASLAHQPSIAITANG